MPYAVEAEAAEMIIDGLPGREISGKIAPRAARAQEIEDRIEDGAQRMAARPPAWSLGREMPFQARPFGVGEIGRIGPIHARQRTESTAVSAFPNTLLARLSPFRRHSRASRSSARRAGAGLLPSPRASSDMRKVSCCQISRRTSANASAKVGARLAIPRGLPDRAGCSPMCGWASSVTSEKRPNSAGRRAADGQLGPLALGLDAEVPSHLLEGHFHLPAQHEPGDDLRRCGRPGRCRAAPGSRTAPAGRGSAPSGSAPAASRCGTTRPSREATSTVALPPVPVGHGDASRRSPASAARAARVGSRFPFLRGRPDLSGPARAARVRTARHRGAGG